jgi:hypothetical protein
MNIANRILYIFFHLSLIKNVKIHFWNKNSFTNTFVIKTRTHHIFSKGNLDPGHVPVQLGDAGAEADRSPDERDHYQRADHKRGSGCGRPAHVPGHLQAQLQDERVSLHLFILFIF